MNSLLQQFREGDRRSIRGVPEVVRQVLADPDLFPVLFDGMSDVDPLVRMRSSDAIEKITASWPVSTLLACSKSRSKMVSTMKLANTQVGRSSFDSKEAAMNFRNVLVRSILVPALAATWAGTAVSQDYPTRPVRIVTSPAGGGSDLVSRLIARGISGLLGQQVIVDNRPAILAPEVVANAAPDGYTVLVAGSTHWLAPLIEKVSYEPLRDFAPVAIVSRSPLVLVVHPSMPLKTVRQLVDLAKSRPGDLNSAVGAPGSSNYLGAVMFDYLAGVKITRIPYKGAAPAMTAIMSGEVQVMFPSAGSAAPHVRSARLRALAVGSARPSALAPGLPTIAASGVPGYDSESLSAVFAPAGTPPAIVSRLNREMARYLQSEDGRAAFLKGGGEAAPGTPEELTAIIKSDMATYGKILRAVGVKAP